VFSTPLGKASVFTPTADGGFIVFVQSGCRWMKPS